MMDHQETAADGIYRMILYNLLCFASVPVFVFGRQARKVAGINYQNPITESCHGFCEISVMLRTACTVAAVEAFRASCLYSKF